MRAAAQTTAIDNVRAATVRIITFFILLFFFYISFIVGSVLLGLNKFKVEHLDIEGLSTLMGPKVTGYLLCVV